MGKWSLLRVSIVSHRTFAPILFGDVTVKFIADKLLLISDKNVLFPSLRHTRLLLLRKSSMIFHIPCYDS